MKIKQAQTVPKPGCDGEGKWIVASRTQDLLILDGYEDGEYRGRYLMNVETHEYGILRPDGYSAEKLCRMFDGQTYWYYLSPKISCNNSDLELIHKTLGASKQYAYDLDDILDMIDRREYDYQSDNRFRKEQRRQERLRKLMDTVPELPEDFMDWAAVAVWKGAYPIYKNDGGEYRCPSCGRILKKEELMEGKKNLPHNSEIPCAKCGRILRIKRRGMRTEEWQQVMIFQETSEGKMVCRQFDIHTRFDTAGHRISLSEASRILMGKEISIEPRSLQIYYNQIGRDYDGAVWDRHNPANKRWNPCYLYPHGIDALKGTDFQPLIRLLSQMSVVGVKADYDRILSARNQSEVMQVFEYLLKGRFYKLLGEESEKVRWEEYYGELDIYGKTSEEVLEIRDRQKINRLRDRNGGTRELEWLRWSDATGQKLSERFLDWIQTEEISTVYMNFILDRMTPEQIMNYVLKQQAAEYRGKTAKSILNQWEDYLAMCKHLGKNVTDEMTYRPRELKRRHNEAVEEIRKLDMIEAMKRDAEMKEKRAKELREKYPGAEEILAEIAPRYKYENEEYKIIIPKSLVDIMSEGNALHHCVGSTDRYFERIRDQETYICFLRKQSEPEIPFYTIEVEPGGTIRQHRGMYDEEPDIKKIRGFLREWQKVLKKRLHSKDWKLAEESRVKREKNLEELRKANNERVLKGLAEDFMEAV